MIKKLILTYSLIALTLIANAQSGSITLNTVQQRSDGSGFVDIYFNLSGPGSAYNISLEVSFNAGSSYQTVPANFLGGDISSISPGSNKHIIWDGLGSFPNAFSTQARLELTATEVSGTGTPCPGMPTFTDPRDGQTYSTVQIGDQCWMKENLNYTTANSWCYDNDAENCNHYGRLYIWQAALAACPPGWHLPSHSEWNELVTYLMSQGYPDYFGATNGAGNALKSCRQIGSPIGEDCNTTAHPRWDSYNTHHGFDEFGFTGFPSGYRFENGSFGYIGNHGGWWTTREINYRDAMRVTLVVSFGNVVIQSDYKSGSYNVRCLRN